jgi:geranylgeranylglycerol-phosphate geranylgeranyltransferase
MSAAGFFAITRPVNAIVAGIAAIVAYLIATGTVVPGAFLLFIIVALITAAGNVINDYFDAVIDAVNRPDRPIPSGTVGRSAARDFAVVLFLAGILVSFFTNPLCIAIAVFNSLLLVAYAARLKSLPLAGNIAVAYLSASMFLFGGALSGWESMVHIIPIAAITFFAMMARELLKAAEDVKGDRIGGADTLPIRFGILSAVRLASIFAVLAVVTSVMPYFWWGPWYLVGISIVDLVILIAAAKSVTCTTPGCVQQSKATTILKAGAFASLIVFALSAVFL